MGFNSSYLFLSDLKSLAHEPAFSGQSGSERLNMLQKCEQFPEDSPGFLDLQEQFPKIRSECSDSTRLVLVTDNDFNQHYFLGTSRTSSR